MTTTDRLIREFVRDDDYAAWLTVVRRDPCAYCARPGPAGTVDHVDPQSRSPRGLGGSHAWINVAGACERCNGAKRDLPLLTFLVRRQPC